MDFAKILSYFQERHEVFYKDMRTCEHSLNEKEFNPYHQEGDVWTHTEMVLEEVKDLNSLDKTSIFIACLLHDVAKPYTRVEKYSQGWQRQVVSFRGHESLSTFLAIDLLLDFETALEIKLNKELILHAINWHVVLHRIKLEENGFLSDENVLFLNRAFSTERDKGAIWDIMYGLNRSDALGRVSDSYKTDKEKFKYLENFIPYYPIRNLGNEEKKPEIIVLIGLPGSGKSSLARERYAKHKVLSLDEMIMNYPKYKGLSYQEARTKAMQSDKMREFISKVYDSIKADSEKGIHLLIDNTNLTEDLQNRVLSNLRKDYYKKAIVFLPGENTLYNQLEERKKKEGKDIPKDVIRKYAAELYIPGYHTFDEIEFIIR
ncbi:MAG: AAA family ATPase [Leptospiraceae bacterium]|nr:AAA family ATPase [Leptospiraceae bacterium]MCP5501285.1 AAA family ATPase [Leptospiraceae bacterium]